MDEQLKYEISEIQNIEELEEFDDEYVYDIGVNIENPYFFANGILVHNSNYFSAYPILKSQIENGDIEWNRDIALEYYDAVCEEVNKTFPKYMRNNHNSPDSFNHTIAAGREIVGSKALFIKKKRYAIMVYDDEGFRVDQDGKSGKVKAMGLDLKRSDTPTFMQEFLKEILLMILEGSQEEEVISKIKDFRKTFRSMKPWDMGTPKRVNKLTYYSGLEYGKDSEGDMIYEGKARIPGHVRAAINYNRLLDLHNDNFSMRISDGMKTIVCKLKDNPMNMTSVAIPIDETRIPDWYKELSFDIDGMEESIVDKKMKNLIGVLKWKLENSYTKTNFDDLFDF